MPVTTVVATSTAKKGLTTQKVILILGLVIIVAAAILIYLFLRPKEEELLPIMTEGNFADISSQIEDRVARGMFETHMNTTWRFPDGTSPSSDAIMGNAATNNFPFSFTVTLEDGEEVFSSPVIPLGKTLQDITLSKDLEPGTYPATCNITMVGETGAPTEGQMGIGITLIVEG